MGFLWLKLIIGLMDFKKDNFNGWKQKFSFQYTAQEWKNVIITVQ